MVKGGGWQKKFQGGQLPPTFRVYASAERFLRF